MGRGSTVCAITIFTCEQCGNFRVRREVKGRAGRWCSNRCRGLALSARSGDETPAFKSGQTLDGRGYVQVSGSRRHRRLHRVRAEAALGKPLPPGAVVHHVDADRDNPNARLVICQDQAFHLFLERRTRALRNRGASNVRDSSR